MTYNYPQLSVFILHLDRAKARLPILHKLVTKLEDMCLYSEIISAVDAQNLTEKDIRSHYVQKLTYPNYPFSLSKSEIACFMSHRSIWKKIVQQNLDFGLIFEDDAVITDDFCSILKKLLLTVHAHNYIRFPSKTREKGLSIVLENLYRLIMPIYPALGTTAQLVGRVAAKNLLKNTEKFDRPIDTTIQMHWHTNVPVLSVLPPIVRHGTNEMESTIQKNVKKKSRTGWIMHEFLRARYRYQLKNYTKKLIFQ